MKKLLLFLAATVLLAGCTGGEYNPTAAPEPPPDVSADTAPNKPNKHEDNVDFYGWLPRRIECDCVDPAADCEE